MKLKLSETQQRIVQHGEGPLLVVAGPGSGKTRVLTERIRRLLNEDKGHFRILALTFTNKAANEMKERLSEIPNIDKRAFIGTLHSFCMEVLANKGRPVGIDRLPNVFESYQDRKQVLFQAAMDNPYLRHKLEFILDIQSRDGLLNRWLDMISTAKNKLYLPEMLDNETDRQVYEAYNSGLRTSYAIDFDDLLLLTYRLFQERPKIADFYRRQYRYICIDEGQDLNEAQYQIICALCGSVHRNVMIVGDAKQAIFVWNGANPKYLSQFVEDFEAESIILSDNFRSSKAVVNAAKSLEPDYNVEGQIPIEGSIELIVGMDEQHEARLVLDYIQRLINEGHRDVEGPITLERCALLSRNRYALSSVEDELNKRQWPYYKQLSAQHESESDLVKDFEIGLRLLANPRDRLHLSMLVKRWNIREDIIHFNQHNNDGLSLLYTLKSRVSKADQIAVINAIESMEWTEQNFKFMNALRSLDSYANNILVQDERALILEDIKTWQKHWNYYLRSQPGGYHTLTSFLGQVALGTTQQPRQEGLALLTVHSAKGLEFDVVVVMGMAEGTFPDYRARNASALEEEKRNAYVAVTRSKRLLAFSYPKTKVMPWGSERKQNPSIYLSTVGLVEPDNPKKTNP